MNRMSTLMNSFQEVLTSLIKQVAIDHPHHCLYQIFALSNGKNVGINERGREK